LTAATIDEPGDRAVPSLRDRAIRGVAWSLTNYAGLQIIRLGSSLVLTRLLFPKAFGLIALVGAYLAGLAMFSDVGLTPYLLQSAKIRDRGFNDAIWSIGVVRGCFFVLAAGLSAFPMAGFYHDPRLVPMLLVASVGQCLTTFNATKLITARRDLRQKELAIYELTTQAVGVTATLVLAWCLRSVWALVLGGVIGSAAQVIGSQFFFPGPRNRWRWDKDLVRELRGFSSWIYLSSVMTFFGLQADRLIIGKLMPLDFLGIYGIAMNFATLPLALVQQGSGLLTSVVVQLRHRADPAIERKLQEARGLLLQSGAVLVALMAISAPAFYGLLYDKRYAQAGAICAVVAFNIWASMVESSVSGIVLAFGDAKGAAANSLGRMLGTLAGAFCGYLAFGIYGLIVGMSLGSLTIYVLSILIIRKHHIHLGWGDVRYWGAFAGLMGSGWGTILLVRWMRPDISLTVASLAGTTVLAGMSLFYLRKRILEFAALGIKRFTASGAKAEADRDKDDALV
jgi:O-antigen/teichoic acid export membrane protein